MPFLPDVTPLDLTYAHCCIYLCIFSCAGSSLLGGFSLTAEGRDYSRLAERGLIAMALLLQSPGSRCVSFRSCSTWAQALCSTWSLPGPGIEPMSLALAGKFSSTVPSICELNCWPLMLVEDKCQEFMRAKLLSP